MTNSRGQRVALVPSSYHPHIGGVEEHTRHVAAQLVARGLAVEVWTPVREGLPRTVELDGCTVRHLPTPLPARRLRSLLSLGATAPGAVRAWAGAWRAFRPDVLHVQCFGPNGTYATVLAALTRTPLVVSSHGETFGDDGNVFGRSALQRGALARALRTGAAVTGCSSVVVDDLVRRFGATDVQVVPNGVDLAGSRPPVRPAGQPGSGSVLLAAGRLVPNKGFDLLVRALPHLAPTARLRLVGDGPDGEALRRLSTELGVEDRVELLGRRSSAEVRGLMAEADVVVVPSRVEAFGIVVLEAWASGTPLVATSRGGPGTLVTDHVDGRLVEPEDTAALAAVIQDVLGDPVRAAALADAGRQTVRAYTWQRAADDYERIYAQAVGG